MIAVVFLGLAFRRLYGISDNRDFISKKQITLQMVANSLYAFFAPLKMFLVPPTGWITFSYLEFFFTWFGLMVLVQTMCELTDLQLQSEVAERDRQRYSTISSYNDCSEEQSFRDRDYTQALIRKPKLSGFEDSIHEHILGRSFGQSFLAYQKLGKSAQSVAAVSQNESEFLGESHVNPSSELPN